MAAAALHVSSTRPQRVQASVREDRAAAQALFHDKGCEHCHGVNGVGGEKGPDLSGVGRRLKPVQIERQIREGGEAMPPFNDVLAPDEVKLLVVWLSGNRALPPKGKRKPPAVVAKPPAGSGSDDQ